MSVTNNKNFPALKSANANMGNRLAFHNYATSNAFLSMDTSKPPTASTSGSSTRRPLNTTPTKLPPAKKLATETEPSLADV